jgi:hypothetical protein
MSKEASAPEAQMNPGEVLFAQVFVPEFVKAATARGYPPRNEAELEQMLKIATMLRINESAAAEAQQKVNGGVLKEAADRLEADTFGAVAPVAVDATPYMADEQVKQALQAIAA